MSRIPLALVLLLLSRCAAAQFDTNGANAALALQGLVPSAVSPADHAVAVLVPGTLTLTVASGVNVAAGIILLASFLPPAGSILPTPWGGTLDLGAPGAPIANVVALADGIGLSVNGFLDPFFNTGFGTPATGGVPTFVFGVSVDATLDGTHVALQAIVRDVTHPPFFYDNTEAVDARLTVGQAVSLSLGDDDVLPVPFLGASAFSFHGCSYTGMFVAANGFVTFGAPSSLPLAGFNIDALAWVMDAPSIAFPLADWDPPTGTVSYLETVDLATIAFADVAHSGDVDTNSFQLRLELDGTGSSPPGLRVPGRFTIDIAALDPAAVVQRGDGLLGHTPGVPMGGPMTLPLLSGSARDRDLRRASPPSPVVSVAAQAQLEEHDANGQNASVLGFDGMGTPSRRGYNSLFSWDLTMLEFVPNPALVPGGAGYTTLAGSSAPSDVHRVAPPVLDRAGGETVTLHGVFFGFDPAGNGVGSVVLDPGGAFGGPYPCAVTGVLDGSWTSGPLALSHDPALSPVRNGQGLVVVTPPLGPPGLYGLSVSFADGSTFSRVVPVP